MRAVQLDLTVPRFVLGKALGPVSRSFLTGAASGLSLVQRELPPLPGPRWVLLEVVSAGICGTDIGTLTLKTSPTLEPFSSFPAVLGHEILARVVECGPGVTGVAPGQRVAVDPHVGCEVRAVPDDEHCPSCRAGRPNTCARRPDEGPLLIAGRPLSRGGIVGYIADLPGGWGEQVLAHESQLYPVPEGLTDDAAVLTEPFAVSMHVALALRPPPGGRALVLGSGAIALGVAWSLRVLGFDGEVVCQVKRPHEAALATAVGASATVAPGDQARAALLATGARPLKPPVGPEVYSGGGFDVVYDCVGSRASLVQALAFTASRGALALVGCAGKLGGLDLTALWARELTVRGFNVYGREQHQGESLHTFALTLREMNRTDAPLGDLVTHHHTLARYRPALDDAMDRGRSGAIKVTLVPGPAGS